MEALFFVSVFVFVLVFVCVSLRRKMPQRRMPSPRVQRKISILSSNSKNPKRAEAMKLANLLSAVGNSVGVEDVVVVVVVVTVVVLVALRLRLFEKNSHINEFSRMAKLMNTARAASACTGSE